MLSFPVPVPVRGKKPGFRPGDGNFAELGTPNFALLRITGANRIVNSGEMTTWYSWTQIEHPSPDNNSSPPTDIIPAITGGQQNATASTARWWALEASGNSNVPTDGSAVVFAWPSKSQPAWIFQYRPIIYGRIDAKKTSGSTTWFTWTEMEPSALVAGGRNFSVKLGGLTGTEESGPLLRNPLFEINQKDIPVGTIVEVMAYPTRVDTSVDAGYLRQRPEAIISETQHADGSTLHEKQKVKWYGALGGNYFVRVTNASGAVGTSTSIGYTDNSSTIRTKIIASGVVTNCTVTGNGSDFVVEFTDNFSVWPFVAVVDADMWSDTPYFCSIGVGGSGGGSVRWGKAQATFTKGVAGACHTVPVKLCNCDGSSPTGSDLTVYFENDTNTNSFRYPNVETNDVIPIVYNDSLSVWQCPVQDEFIGAIKLITAAGTIPHGWQHYAAADGRFVLGDSTGDESTGGSTDIVIYADIGGGASATDATRPACIYAVIDSAHVRTIITSFNDSTDRDLFIKCGSINIPALTVTDYLPPWIKLRYIERYNNGI